MIHNVLALLYMAQLLGICAIFGMALRNARQYRTPFGKLFLPYKTQIILCIWLFGSLFVNLLTVCVMK